jgi:hypothetical protein
VPVICILLRIISDDVDSLPAFGLYVKGVVVLSIYNTLLIADDVFNKIIEPLSPVGFIFDGVMPVKLDQNLRIIHYLHY